MTDMIKNERGEVAIVYYQTIPKVISVHKRQYAFAIRRNISLSWVKPEDVDAILSITNTCCGGNTKTVFRYANSTEVRVWMNGGR